LVLETSDVDPGRNFKTSLWWREDVILVPSPPSVVHPPPPLLFPLTDTRFDPGCIRDGMVINETGQLALLVSREPD